jgi:cytochrome c-type biogenesis protein
MSTGSEIGLLAAAMAGTISFLSPCVLPLVPGYVSYIAGHDGDGTTRPKLVAMALAMSFVLGFSTVFVALGASATFAGQFLLSRKYQLNLVGGAIVILFGVFATGLVSMPWLERDIRFHGSEIKRGYLGSYLLGLAFGFGWTPCIGPVLGAILTISAATATVKDGVALLVAYSVGLGIPFLVAAWSTKALLRGMRPMRKLGGVLKVSAGGTMIAMGAAMMTGYLSTFSYWLLETFPLLSTIG